MLIVRIAKVIMSASLAVFCLLVAFDNITDYNTNYAFVQHVLSMSTTFPGSELRYRAITDPALWRLCYAFIIAVEAAAGALFLVGAVQMAAALRAPAAAFNRAKTYVIAAVLTAFLLWFFGFMVVGGEWFSMWQSETWNGQEAAFRFYVTALAVLIFVNQQDGDLPGATPTPGSSSRRRRAANTKH